MNHYLDQGAGRLFSTDDGEFLYFGGTSYLGLQYHPEFQEKLIENIRKLGTNFGASRKANVRLSVYDEFETEVARKTEMQDAICLSSGFLAGQMLSNYFSRKDFQQFCAPHTHPAIIGKESIVFDNYEELKRQIETCQDEVILFLDSIDFDGQNYPNFNWLQDINLQNVILVVDDSHGFGLIGENGFGLGELLKTVRAKELIICGSLGKALATPCGIICGNTDRLQDLRNSGFYGGGSPPSPSALKTFLQSEELIVTSLRKLRQNIQLFNTEVSAEFQKVQLKDHPVFTYHDEALTDFLYSEGIITTNFRYPLPDSDLLSKVVLSAAHSEDDILKLTKSISQFYSKI